MGKKDNKTVFYAKNKKNIIEILISKALICYSDIIHEEFAPVNNVLNKDNDVEEAV